MPVRYPTTANDRCLRRPLRTDIPRTELKYHHRREYVRTLLVNVRHCDRAAIGGNFQITHDILLFWIRGTALPLLASSKISDLFGPPTSTNLLSGVKSMVKGSKVISSNRHLS